MYSRAGASTPYKRWSERANTYLLNRNLFFSNITTTIMTPSALRTQYGIEAIKARPSPSGKVRCVTYRLDVSPSSIIEAGLPAALRHTTDDWTEYPTSESNAERMHQSNFNLVALWWARTTGLGVARSARKFHMCPSAFTLGHMCADKSLDERFVS